MMSGSGSLSSLFWRHSQKRHREFDPHEIGSPVDDDLAVQVNAVAGVVGVSLDDLPTDNIAQPPKGQLVVCAAGRDGF